MTVQTNFIARLELESSSEINFNPKIVSENHFVLGAEYSGGFKFPEFYKEYNCVDKEVDLNQNSKINLNQRFEVVPEIEIYFYSVLGPSAELIAFEEFNADLVYEESTLLWDLGLDIGLAIQGALDVGPLHIDKLSFPLVEKEWGIISYPIYSSPHSLKIISGNNQKGIIGEKLPNKIELKVFDNIGNALSGVNVFFETFENNGYLSRQVVLSDEQGLVQTEWILGSKKTEQTLHAYLKDGKGNEIEGSRIEVNALLLEGNICEEEKELFEDFRDGKTYGQVQIGNQIWMSENLNYFVEGSLCYDNLESNCDFGGMLYTWDIAKEVCPDGWHLPSDEEWEELAEKINEDFGPFSKRIDDWFEVGGYLKSESFWGEGFLGSNNYCFSAIPCGIYNPSGFFGGKEDGDYWWSSSENSSSEAWFREVKSVNSDFNRHYIDKNFGFSVRCIKD